MKKKESMRFFSFFQNILKVHVKFKKGSALNCWRNSHTPIHFFSIKALEQCPKLKCEKVTKIFQDSETKKKIHAYLQTIIKAV